MVEIIPDLLSEDEENLLPEKPVPVTFNTETAETLTVLSQAAQASFNETEKAPVITDKQTEDHARERFALLESAEKAKTIDEMVLDKIIANAPPEEFEALLSLSATSDQSSVLERRTAKRLTAVRLESDEYFAASVRDTFSPEARAVNAEDKREDLIATLLRINTSRQKIMEKLKDKGVSGKVLDAIAIIILPFHSSAANAKVFGRTIGGMGESIRGFTEDFWNAPLDERMRIMEQLDKDIANNTIVSENLFSAVEQLELMMGVTDTESWFQSGIEAVDALFGFSILAKAFLWMKNMSRVGRLAGAKDLPTGRALVLSSRDKAAKAERPAGDFGKTIEGTFTDITPGAPGKALTIVEGEELIENVLPSSAIALKGPEKSTGPTLNALETVTVMEEFQKLLPGLKAEFEKRGVKVEDFDLPDLIALLEETIFPEVLTATEAGRAALDAKRAILNTVGISDRARSIVDPKRYTGGYDGKYAFFDVDVENVSGVQTVNVYFGTGPNKDRGFVSEKAALKGASRMGLEVGFFEAVHKPMPLKVDPKDIVFGKPPKDGLVVAGITKDGKLYYGTRGQLHSDLPGHNERGGQDWAKLGFAGPDGRILLREEAMKVAKEQDELVVTATTDNQLDATDLKDFRKRSARRMAENGVELSERSGEWFIKVSRNPGQAKYITAIDPSEIPKMLPFLARWISGSAMTNTLRMAIDSRLAVLASTKLMKELVAAVDAINPVTWPGGPGLRKKQKKIYLELMLEIQQNDEWKTGTQVRNWYLRHYQREPSDREIRAYAATRLLYAFDYVGRNAMMKRDLTSIGYQEGIVRGTTKGPLVLKEVQTTSLPTNMVSIYDTRTGKFVFPRNKAELDRMIGTGSNIPLPKKEGAMVHGRGVVLLKLLEHHKKYGDYIIAGKADVNIRPLPARVLNMSKGPHRIYDIEVSGRFIKQQRIKMVRGQLTVLHPKTHFAVSSGKKARGFVDDYNEALEAWKVAKASGDMVDKAAATEIINTNTIFSSFEDMSKAIKEGRMETTPFEALKDGEFPTHRAEEIRGLPKDPDHINLSDQTWVALHGGHLYTSRRGPHLLEGSPDGKRGAIIDHDAVLSRAINNIVNNLAYGPYRISQPTRWVKTYGKYLVPIEGGSIMDQFFFGKFDKRPNAPLPMSPQTLREAETQRDSILRLLRTSGDLEESVSRYRNMIIDLIDDKVNHTVADRFASITSGNPVASARGAVFKAFLGFWGPSQSIIQRSTMPFVIAASPIHGTRAMAIYPIIKTALSNSQHTEAIVKAWNSVTKEALIDNNTLQQLINDLKRTAFAEIDRNMGQWDVMADQANLLTIGGAFLKRITDAGMIFFMEAEEFMRIMGFTITWLEFHAKTGRGPKTTAEWGALLVKANALAGNMTRAEKAWWQEGLLGLPFQFLGQPFRITELMAMTQKGGLGKHERWRATMAMILAFGPLLGFQGDSMPTGSLSQYIRQRYFDATGKELDKNKLLRFLTAGVVGLMFPDTDIRRTQPWGQDFFLMKIFDTNQGLSIWDLLGATGAMGERLYDATIGSAKLWALLSANIEIDLVPITMADIANDILGTLVSYSRKEKAIHAWQTGRYISKNGRILQDDVDAYDTIGIGLGFPPLRSSEAFAGSMYMSGIKGKIRKDGMIIARFIIDAVTADMGSLKQRKNIAYAEYMLSLYEHNRDLIAIEVDKNLNKAGNVYTSDMFMRFQDMLNRHPLQLLKNEGEKN